MINWHRMFGGSVCVFFENTSLSVILEKELSLKQQFVDVVILQQIGANIILPAELPDGLDNLREHNLLTYKSHQESLTRASMFELYGHFVNYCKQAADQNVTVNFDNCQLYAVTARKPEKLFSQGEFQQVCSGVYDFDVLGFTVHIIVTGGVANAKRNAIWQLFSGRPEQFKQGVRNYGIDKMQHSELARQIFRYYQLEELFPMPYSFEQFKKDLHEETLNSLTEGERIQVMHMLPVEKRLEGISTEQRLEGIPAEQLMAHVPTERRLEGIPVEQLMAHVPTEQRLEGIPAEQLMAHVPTEQRLEGIPAEQLMAHVPTEQRLEGLSDEELKKLLAVLNKRYS